MGKSCIAFLPRIKYHHSVKHERFDFMTKFLKNVLSLAIAAIVILPTSAFAIGEEGEGEGGEEGIGEAVYSITYDFNGGATFEGQSTYVERNASVAPVLTEENLIRCFERSTEDPDECHPLDVFKGKKLDYVTVDGERREINQDESFEINSDKTVKYFWEDIELKKYDDVSDGNGNTIVFDEEIGHDYHLRLNTFSFSMTDEELAAIDVTRELYETFKTMTIEAVGNQGTVVGYLEADVYEISMCDDGKACQCKNDEGVFVDCENYARGPFTLRIKLTDKMKGYKSYKLMYVDLPKTADGEVITEDPITCDVDGDYLICTVPHFSGYAILGSNDANAPDTGVMTNLREGVSESLILAIVLATAFVSAGVFLIVSDFRHR